MLILFSQLDIVPGWLCIWSLPWSLYFYSLLPSEHNKDSHAKDVGWRFSELPESLSSPVKGARRLGNVQRGARQLHPLLHVLGHHQHELLLAAGSSEQLITMVLSWEKQALTSEIYNQWLILTSWAEYSEILPTPYWAVISRKCINVKKNLLYVAFFRCCDISSCKQLNSQNRKSRNQKFLQFHEQLREGLLYHTKGKNWHWLDWLGVNGDAIISALVWQILHMSTLTG